MLSLFKSKPFFSAAEQKKIMHAIQDAEKRTSGEVRLYVESHCRYVDPVDRAAEVFYNLKMEQTAQRNAVLVYMALKDRQLAIFGDEGIYKKTGDEFWKERVNYMLTHFNRKDYVAGITAVVTQIGEALYQHFPYDHSNDKNELPDDIVFGK